MLSYAGRDLAEIYNVPCVVVATSSLYYFTNVYDPYDASYLPLFSIHGSYKATDNIFIRALRYFPKTLIRSLFLYIISRESDEIRSKYNLSSNRLRPSNAYAILESFYGLQPAMLFPPYLEPIGFLDDPLLNNLLDYETQSR